MKPRLRVSLKAAALAAVVACVLCASARAAGIDLTGTWSVVSHCDRGWCAGKDFPGENVLTQTGTTISGTYTQGTTSGTFDGHGGTITSTQAGYQSTFVFTASADGNTLTGTWTDSHNVGGTAIMKRLSESPPPTTTGPLPTTNAPAAPFPAVVNGDFSSGNDGFTSAYTEAATLGAPATYSLSADPNTLNGAWPKLGDHTSGSGLMMIVNGSTAPNQVVWAETVIVKPQTTYELAVSVASLYASPPVLRYSVNGAEIGSRSAPTTVGTWETARFRWRSGSATSAALRIVDINLGFGGNDFALDDISFKAVAAAAPSPAPAVPARHPRVSTLATSIASPTQAFSSPRASLENAAVAAVAVLFITFPSQLFNHTFEENYADIRKWWELRFGFLAKARKKRQESKRHIFRNTTSALFVLLIGGVLGGLLDPHFGWNGPSAATYASVVCSTIFGLSLSAFVAYEYRKRRGRSKRFHVHALPAGLLIAAVCVLTSRLTGFQPGYLYGLIVGVAFRGALQTNEQGHTTTLTVLATIAVALLAYGLRVPLNHLAGHPHEAWPVVLGDDFVGSLFTGGIVGSTIGLFPLRFLPGGTIVKWHRGAWALTFAIVVFLFLELILNPGSGGHPGGAGLTTAIVLFVVYGLGSVAFYHHFARKRKVTPAV